MSEPVFRSKGKESGYGPAQIQKTFPVPLAVDNLVCVICGQHLSTIRERWVMVSNATRKGVMVCACESHAPQAANWLGERIGVTTRVPEESGIPNPDQN